MNCPFCKAELPEEAAFCGFCGKKIKDYTAPEAVTDGQTAEDIQQVPEVVSSVEENAVSDVRENVTAQNETAEIDTAESSFAAPKSAFSAPESAVTAPENSAVESNAFSASEDSASVSSEPIHSNSTGVSLAKHESVSDNSKSSCKADDVAAKLKDGAEEFGKSLKDDASSAAAAVKSGDFKALLKNKVFVICCAAVVVVVLLMWIILAVVAGSSNSKLEIKGYYTYYDDGSERYFFYNGKQIKQEFSDSAKVRAHTPDNTICVVDDDDVLYLLDKGKVSKITDDFDTTSVSVSANGKTVAYVSDDCVFVYNGGKPKQIAELESDYACNPVVSPDGKIVAFADLDDDDIKTYVWKGGSKAIDLDTDIVPIAVSNGGKMLYGNSLNGNLYYVKGLKKDAEEKIDSYSYIRGISTDHTKLVYIDGGKTYCFNPKIDADSGIRAYNGSAFVMADCYYSTSSYSLAYIDDFDNFYIETSDAIHNVLRKGKEYDCEKNIIKDIEDICLSDDMKSFVYIDDDYTLWKGKVSNAKNAKEIADDVQSVKANSTLSSVYYLDDDYRLYYVGKDEKISSDVRRYVVTESGICVFVDDDGELYYSVKGGEKKKVGFDEVSSLKVHENYVYMVSDDTLYISTNGKSYDKSVEVD